MIFAIFDAPTSDDDMWHELRRGTITKYESFEYEKRWCGAGTFELTVPAEEADIDKLALNRIIMSADGEFVIKALEYQRESVRVSGYDLNGMLSDRITVAMTDDGRDPKKGVSTSRLAYYYVNKNCMRCENAERNYPAFAALGLQDLGLSSDAASPRFENLEDVVSEICGAQNIGWSVRAFDVTSGINISSGDNVLFVLRFHAPLEIDDPLTVGETPRERRYSYGLGNVDGIVTKRNIANAKNTLYCEISDGTVQQYSPRPNAGFNRSEDFTKLSCALGELNIYAERELGEQYREERFSEPGEIIADEDLSGVHPYGLGRKAEVYDKRAGLLTEGLITSVKITRNSSGAFVKPCVGQQKIKLLDSLRRKYPSTYIGGGDLAYLTKLDFTGEGAFDVSFLDGVDEDTNSFTYEEEDGRITKISNTTTGRDISITYGEQGSGSDRLRNISAGSLRVWR